MSFMHKPIEMVLRQYYHYNENHVSWKMVFVLKQGPGDPNIEKLRVNITNSRSLQNLCGDA